MESGIMMPESPKREPTVDWWDDPLWYKDAVIYELHVKAFFDSDNNGVGDFRGLTKKLDYLQDLGVNTLWLLPFYPSPFRDDGYDIADYHNVDPKYGTRADFKNFVREAHRRRLKIITELVINHTSDQHPWFQAARKAPPGSSKRNFYVWSDTEKKFADTRIIFTDTEKSNWAWDDVAQAYYWHRFFSHQPDLNHNNPAVVDAVIRVMRFWLDMGVDGLRLDAIPYLCVREGTSNENLPETHEVIKKIRAVIDANYPNRMLLAEANQWPEDVREYFGEGDECHMAYHFPLMPRLYMAIAQEDRHPIVDIMAQTPEIPDSCQWAIFLRNHDELTLEMVTSRERDYMYSMYAVDPLMRVNVGIRRRLAPLMENNREKIELINFLLMTMPGSPILYYGDEIGMGDNFYLGDRNSVRTPMQWSPDRNGGFSRADPQRLFLPPMMDPIYGYEAVSVEAQMRNPSSLLNWTKRLIAARKNYRAFGNGTLRLLDPGNRKILAYVREWEDEKILCVTNLSRTAQPVELNLADFKGRVPVELVGQAAFPPIGDLPYLLTLKGYGYYAFRLATDVEAPNWHQDYLPNRELPVLVLTEGFLTFLSGRSIASAVRRAIASRTQSQLQHEILAPYLRGKRWFAGKDRTIIRIDIREQSEWRDGEGQWLLTLIEVHFSEGDPQLYFLPLAMAWEDETSEEKLRALLPWTLAKVREKARMGVLYSGYGDNGFCRALVRAMARGTSVPLGEGSLHFQATGAIPDLAALADEPVYHPALEQSNIAVLFGERLFLKCYGRLQRGTNPEVEVGRFLTQQAAYGHAVPVGGFMEYRSPTGDTIDLALLQSFLANQGSAWNYAVDYLERTLAEPSPVSDDGEPNQHAFFMHQMNNLGKRTAELHQAFGKATGNPAFDPEPVTAADLDRWFEAVRQDAVQTFDRLESRLGQIPETLQTPCKTLLSQRPKLLENLHPHGLTDNQLMRSRYHGDYHLGQVLRVQDDFIITDFEGEPARPLAERRAKHSPLRDVAGMLRSFSYAAAVAVQRSTTERPGDRDGLVRQAIAWEQQTAQSFLEGYRSDIVGCPTWPTDEEAIAQLMRLFLIEKALYEIRYELDNRPDWVVVPVAGLLRQLENISMQRRL